VQTVVNGGQAGTGKSKVRGDKEYYAELGRKSGEAKKKDLT